MQRKSVFSEVDRCDVVFLLSLCKYYRTSLKVDQTGSIPTVSFPVYSTYCRTNRVPTESMVAAFTRNTVSFTLYIMNKVASGKCTGCVHPHSVYLIVFSELLSHIIAMYYFLSDGWVNSYGREPEVTGMFLDGLDGAVTHFFCINIMSLMPLWQSERVLRCGLTRWDCQMHIGVSMHIIIIQMAGLINVFMPSSSFFVILNLLRYMYSI